MAIFRLGGGHGFSCYVFLGGLSKISPDVKEAIRGAIKKIP